MSKYEIIRVDAEDAEDLLSLRFGRHAQKQHFVQMTAYGTLLSELDIERSQQR